MQANLASFFFAPTTHLWLSPMQCTENCVFGTFFAALGVITASNRNHLRCVAVTCEAVGREGPLLLTRLTTTFSHRWFPGHCSLECPNKTTFPNVVGIIVWSFKYYRPRRNMYSVHFCTCYIHNIDMSISVYHVIITCCVSLNNSLRLSQEVESTFSCKEQHQIEKQRCWLDVGWAPWI